MNATATLNSRRFRPGFWTAVFVVLFLAFCAVTVLRFTKGLGAVTNLSDRFPWGLWIGFDLLCGVMLAAGGYQSLDLLKLSGLSSFLPILVVGFVTAAVVGWFAIKWLLGYLNKHSLYVFAGYCAVIGTACLVFSQL